jgi:hypothetical protein
MLPPLTAMNIPKLGFKPNYGTIEPIDYTRILKQKVVFSDNINENYMNQIFTFVEKMNSKGQSNEHYEKTRFTTKENAENDQLIGKKGEFFALHFLEREFAFPLISIDLEIRQKHQKGWMHDLPYNFHYNFLPNFHVKTCSKKTLGITKGVESWTFQQWDKSIFNQRLEYDYGVFVYLDDAFAKEATIMIVYPIHEVKKILRQPTLSKYRDSKTCLYFEEFSEKEIDNRKEIYYIS